MSPAQERRRISVSSNVVPGVVAGTEAIIIALAGLISYALMVKYSTETVGVYIAAICFICVVVLLVFQFAGLYQFDIILRPAANLDKILVSFLTSFLFLLAAAFAFKISATYSRAWIGVFAGVSCLAILAERL